MIWTLAILTALASDPVDVRAAGAFGFPQDLATILCDTDDLRLSLVTDAEHLYVQAVVWGDGNDTLGLTADGRDIGDNSTLILDVDADELPTVDADRDYSLNPWPSRPGLNYSICMGPNSSTGLQADSRGRGSINYVHTTGDAVVRVECFAIPLSEIGLEPGSTLRLAYYAWSAEPSLTLNSVGFESQRRYYPHHLPAAAFHEITLANCDEILDLQQVPEGRESIEVAQEEPVEAPKVGQRPPEVHAAQWLNWEGHAPTLASLTGKVVVVEFWATWCGPCVAGIPHLNELHAKHADDGLVILSLTDQALVGIQSFLDQTDMNYTIGAHSDTSTAYGITYIPRAFVIGRDGILRWEGHPGDEAFDAAIENALSQTAPR